MVLGQVLIGVRGPKRSKEKCVWMLFNDSCWGRGWVWKCCASDTLRAENSRRGTGEELSRRASEVVVRDAQWKWRGREDGDLCS
jgi:hypothetical protein